MTFIHKQYRSPAQSRGHCQSLQMHECNLQSCKPGLWEKQLPHCSGNGSASSTSALLTLAGTCTSPLLTGCCSSTAPELPSTSHRSYKKRFQSSRVGKFHAHQDETPHLKPGSLFLQLLQGLGPVIKPHFAESEFLD